MSRLDRLKWSFVRWRLETRAHPPTLLKLQLKLVHLLRRIVIAIATLLFRKYRQEEPLDLARTSSILIIPNQPLGDLLVTSPIWRALKRRNPKVKIGVAISTRNRSMIGGFPEVDKTYLLFAKHYFKRIREVLRARRDKWDVVLTTVGFFKPVRYAFLMRFIAGNAVTASMHDVRDERYHNIFSYCFRRSFFPYPQPILLQFEELAERLFDIKFEEWERAPKFEVKSEIVEQCGNRLDAIKKSTNTSKVVVMHLEAKRSGLEWGYENVAMFSHKFSAANPDTVLLLTASPMFILQFPAFVALPLERVEYFAATSIDEMIALVGLCDLVITPDTVIVHFAALYHTPMVLLFECKSEWMPFEATYSLLSSGFGQQVKLIPVSNVLDQANLLLRIKADVRHELHIQA
jgi:ADP-heptose:LPS heptosyltransferase